MSAEALLNFLQARPSGRLPRLNPLPDLIADLVKRPVFDRKDVWTVRRLSAYRCLRYLAMAEFLYSHAPGRRNGMSRRSVVRAPTPTDCCTPPAVADMRRYVLITFRRH